MGDESCTMAILRSIDAHRNSYEDYRQAVREICEEVLIRGIQGNACRS